MRRAALRVVVGMMLLAGSAVAQTEIVLHDFGGFGDGGTSEASLIFDSVGNLYGTTNGGGFYQRGTVFRLTPMPDGTWVESVLYDFSGGNDGGSPIASLVIDSVGNLYGTTFSGGDSSCLSGCGVVFRLLPQPTGKWKLNLLYRFVKNGHDGVNPVGGAILDDSRNLYGTTTAGGQFNQGTIYRLSPRPAGFWTEHILHSFDGNDGGDPTTSLILDSFGNLYGTTERGGSEDCGTVFQLVPNSSGQWNRHVLNSFLGRHGCLPDSPLIFDTSGNLYGTTSAGGTKRDGVVFKLAPQTAGKWTETILHNFSGLSDGNGPHGLVLDASGNLYGTTQGLGAEFGTVFQLSPNISGTWDETILHTFTNDAGGCNPSAAPILDLAGDLYGTTEGCGSSNGGVVFEIIP